MTLSFCLQLSNILNLIATDSMVVTVLGTSRIQTHVLNLKKDRIEPLQLLGYSHSGSLQDSFWQGPALVPSTMALVFSIVLVRSSKFRERQELLQNSTETVCRLTSVAESDQLSKADVSI